MVQMTAIVDLAKRIAELYKPERIILFGSRARGTARNDSDVDLLVVMSYRGRELTKAVEILMRTNPGFAVDVLVRRPGEVRRAYREFDPLIRDAFDEGKVLYEQNGTRMARQGRGRLHKRGRTVTRKKVASK